MSSKIELRPEPEHRHVGEIPRNLERWGIALIVIIFLALVFAAFLLKRQGWW